MVGFRYAPGGRYTVSRVTLRMLILQAYDLKDYQVLGGPSWISSAPFDINAKAENPNVTRDQIMLMLQSLLAERFKLKFHRETRELPIYWLLIGKDGHKLQLAAMQPNPEAASFMMFFGRGQLNMQRVPISALVAALARQLGRPVLDKTDLKGNYDIKLNWTPNEGRGGIGGAAEVAAPAVGDFSGPSIFTAVEEQLGLRLESQKGPVEVLVIDSVEKPSGN